MATLQQRVAVVGAGAAGLSMCKALINEQQIQCVVFEKSAKIGGVWVYAKDGKLNGHRNAMYKNLRTNLPKEIMAFPEFPFPNDLPSFMRHEDVLKYLEDYADHFGLRKCIKFQNEVTLVKPCETKGTLKWQVITKDLRNSKTEQTGIFDAVVVCNGHFSQPRIPEVAGLQDYLRPVMHSQQYSEPDNFQDKTILILGANNSGLDICLEISSVAKKVYLVHLKNKMAASLPANVEEILGTLTRAFPDGSVEINNECRKVVDCVIFCTGYNYAFPFLAPECKIEVNNNRVTSLYKHVFNTAFPSLSFVGLCTLNLPFPNFDLQSQWVASVLTGRKVLPSRDEMRRDEEIDYHERLNTGVALRYMHSLGVDRLGTYHDQLADLASVPRLSPIVSSLFKYVIARRSTDILTYKNTNFILSGNQWFFNEEKKN